MDYFVKWHETFQKTTNISIYEMLIVLYLNSRKAFLLFNYEYQLIQKSKLRMFVFVCLHIPCAAKRGEYLFISCLRCDEDWIRGQHGLCGRTRNFIITKEIRVCPHSQCCPRISPSRQKQWDK